MDDGSAHGQDAHEQSKSKKRKQASKQASKSESNLITSIESNAHRINGEFIPACYAMLGADLHEAGPAKKKRDALYLHILSALDIPGVRANPSISSTAGMGGRLRLVKANLQTVDQVRALFAFDFPPYIALIAIEIFGSTHG